MPRRSSFILLPLIVAATLCSTASAHEEVFTAILNGAAESPPNASSGTGSVIATLDLDLVTLRLQIDFVGLEYPTTAAHIHAPTSQAFSGTAGVATQVPSFESFPLNVTAGTYDHTFDLTLASFYNPDFINANGGRFHSLPMRSSTLWRTARPISTFIRPLFPMERFAVFWRRYRNQAQ